MYYTDINEGNISYFALIRFSGLHSSKLKSGLYLSLSEIVQQLTHDFSVQKNRL